MRNLAPSNSSLLETRFFTCYGPLADGRAPKYKCENKVNPTALILSGALMLEYLGEKAAAEKLERAVSAIIAEGKDVTYDIQAERNDLITVGTQEMAEAICKKMRDM